MRNMKKYKIVVRQVIDFYYEVEIDAENEDDARDEAYNIYQNREPTRKLVCDNIEEVIELTV
jgi:hypothetical protein